MNRGTGDTDPLYIPQELFLIKRHRNWLFLVKSLILLGLEIVGKNHVLSLVGGVDGWFGRVLSGISGVKEMR